MKTLGCEYHEEKKKNKHKFTENEQIIINNVSGHSESELQ